MIVLRLALPAFSCLQQPYSNVIFQLFVLSSLVASCRALPFHHQIEKAERDATLDTLQAFLKDNFETITDDGAWWYEERDMSSPEKTNCF